MTSSRAATLALVALLLVGCGAATTPAGSETRSTGAVSAPTTGSASIPSGDLPEPSAPVIDQTDPAGSIAAAELAMRQEDRDRVGLVNLGPGAVELAAAMDASAGRALAAIHGGIPASDRTLGGQLASVGGPIAAPEPGFNSFVVFATLITSLDQFAREPQSVTVPYDTETVEIGGNTGTIRTTMTLKAVVSGSQLSVDLTMKTKGQVVDRATGAVLFGIDSIVSGHIDVDFCPDASGQSKANVKLTSSEVYTGGAAGSGRGISREFAGSVVITVGDDARIAKVEGTDQGTEDSKGGIPPAGSSSSDVPASTRTASDNIANDGNGNRLPGSPRAIQFGGDGSTTDQQVAMWGSMTVFVETMVTAAAKEAEKLWREGKCLELTVDPDGGDVEPDEVTQVTATLRHRIEGNELDKPVEAALSGVKTIEPSGEKQPAPATVTYTAGPNDGDIGRITFKSVSNRGIAEKSVTFTVRRAAWKVTFTGTDTEEFQTVVKNTFQAKITDFRITAVDEKLSGDGRLHLKGTVTSGPCSGPLDQVAALSIYQGTLVGTGQEAVLRIVIRATSPNGQVVHMRCKPAGGADIQAEGHAERFGDPLLQFDLPAAGGTVRVSKTSLVGGQFRVTVKGTFTVTRTR